MSDETKGLVRFWSAFGGLIIVVITAAFLMSNRMAVTEEKVKNLELREKRIEMMEQELKSMNSLLIKINTNQEQILKRMPE